MATGEKLTYYVTLRKTRRGWLVSYHVGSEGKLATLLRLNGRSADKVFRGVIKALARQGAVIPSRVSEEEEVYAVREDLGPVVGAYLMLARRAKNLDKWEGFLNDMLGGQYFGMAKAFSLFLEMAIDLSKSLPSGGGRRRYTISPLVLESLSTAMKHFVDRMIKAYQAPTGG